MSRCVTSEERANSSMSESSLLELSVGALRVHVGSLDQLASKVGIQQDPYLDASSTKVACEACIASAVM
ncbi:hypothetical protein PR003_g7596 [Phytophthora rubi]|uniref:Uncharacterized protein n=2 Tax=Phytophthora rubi TaxID=129364 RepID=A0A6A4FDH3_9STRA|nr:hypothetical protein PR001_g7142 [Phytophthora rubi]KAE9346105.1 hypothetical protein PR003_g7596 [Phytophthora rubi]